MYFVAHFLKKQRREFLSFTPQPTPSKALLRYSYSLKFLVSLATVKSFLPLFSLHVLISFLAPLSTRFSIRSSPFLIAYCTKLLRLVLAPTCKLIYLNLSQDSVKQTKKKTNKQKHQRILSSRIYIA